MKYIKAILFLSLFFTGVFSNEIKLGAPDNFTFSEVVTQDGATKGKLYNTCMSNFVPALKPASKLIWIQGERNGVTIQSPETMDMLVVRHSIDVSFAGGYSCIVYNIKFNFKEGKYKYSIEDITLSHSTATKGMTTETLEEYIIGKKEKKQIRYMEEVNEELNKVIALVQKKMKVSNEDW